jgi:uncharacterized membrane protein YraQ (UPF0718 family)/copper chaperone CopZ
MLDFMVGFLKEFITILSEMAPYLLLGFLIAGILHASVSEKTIQKYFGGNKYASSVNAAIFGVPLPLCSCGVIPTGMSLYKNGASKGSTVSFLISTPQTGADSILVTYSLLGLPFAVIRPIVAFITGVIGGIITSSVSEKSDSEQNQVQNPVNLKQLTWKQKIVDVFHYGFVEFLQDISKWLIIGLILAAAISALIPDDFFAGLGLSPILQMLIVLVFSVPLYICATASVPLAAVLILKGISPGAALVLLMAGPATNAATITIIGKVMGKRVLFSYLGTIVIGALLFGLIIDYFLPVSWFLVTDTGHLMHHHEAIPQVFKYASAIILSGLIIYGFLEKYLPKKRIINNNLNFNTMTLKTINVQGMTCNHCKANVENNLQKLDFISGVNIDLATGNVELDGKNIDLEKVKDVVNGLGYKYVG